MEEVVEGRGILEQEWFAIGWLLLAGVFLD
jgi:hypothetical protein